MFFLHVLRLEKSCLDCLGSVKCLFYVLFWSFLVELICEILWVSLSFILGFLFLVGSGISFLSLMFKVLVTDVW